MSTLELAREEYRVSVVYMKPTDTIEVRLNQRLTDITGPAICRKSIQDRCVDEFDIRVFTRTSKLHKLQYLL